MLKQNNIDTSSLFKVFDTEKKVLENALKTKPLWTVSANNVYDFTTRSSTKLTLSTHFFFSIKSGNTVIPFDFSFSNQWQQDTTQKSANMNRKVFEAEFGKNFTIGKKKWLEIKPAFSYSSIKGTLYSKEQQNKFMGSLTPRLKINDQFWLPVTIKYDPKNGDFLGLFTVQYSFK